MSARYPTSITIDFLWEETMTANGVTYAVSSKDCQAEILTTWCGTDWQVGAICVEGVRYEPTGKMPPLVRHAVWLCIAPDHPQYCDILAEAERQAEGAIEAAMRGDGPLSRFAQRMTDVEHKREMAE